MPTCFEKIGFTLTTYSKAWQFIKRQNHPGRIKAVQNEKLRRLIKHCYENIKYYRELFDENRIKPDDIKTADDLENVPLLTKDDLRHRFWDLLPKELPACRISRTSGSTGIPVCILSDINSRINNSAAIIRYRKQLGLGFVGGAILTPLKNAEELSRKSHLTFLQGIHRTFYVNPYSTNKCDVRYAEETIKRLHEPALIGITPAIRALAWRIRDGHLPALKPRAVLPVGEYLSPEVRNLLEETFRVKVTDIYACSESGDVAWQCRKGQRYHINADNCIVEVLKDGKPVEEGQTGEVVITNLNRYSMPFIRFKNGDLASFSSEKCSCGCRLPVLSQIVGRTGEDIHLPNGKTIPWNQLKGFMNHPGIRQFQLVQDKGGALTIKFVPEGKNHIEQTQNILMPRFKGLLGDSIRIEFSAVKSIEPAPSGKSKLVVSHYDPF